MSAAYQSGIGGIHRRRQGRSGAPIAASHWASLDATACPSSRATAAIRRHKAGIVALLTTAEGDWTAEDWRVFFDERASIAEHDGARARADAEQQAFECCVMEWLWQHPPPASGPERCAHCGEPLGEDGLPFLTGDGGHVWLHSGCHGDWTARRRAEAVAALDGFGIRVREITKPEN